MTAENKLSGCVAALGFFFACTVTTLSIINLKHEVASLKAEQANMAEHYDKQLQFLLDELHERTMELKNNQERRRVPTFSTPREHEDRR